MATRLLTAIMATTAMSALAQASYVQTVDPLFQSPNQDTVPSYSASLPNGGAPVALVNKVTGIGRTFGSSSTDTRSAAPVLPGYGIRWSNGNVHSIELLSPIIGATNRSGSTAPLASPTPTNFAQVGTTSLTAQPQATQFQAAYGRFAPNDIAVMFLGINDWSGGNVTAGNFRAIAAANVTNQTTMAAQIIALGARNLVVLGQAPFDTFQFFTASRGTVASNAAAISQGAQLVDQGLLPNLVALRTVRGHRKLRQAGVEALLQVFEGQSHAQYYADPFGPETIDYHSEVARFFDAHLAP